MKKTIILSLAVALSAAAMAITIPEKILSVKLSSATQSDEAVSFFQATDALDNEYQPSIESSKRIVYTENPNAIFLYTNTNYAAPNDKVGVLYVTDIYNKNIAIRTNGIETEYKFTFPAVNVTDVASLGEIFIIDTENDSIFKAATDFEYEFTAPLNAVIEDRFFIYKPLSPAGGELEICHHYGMLEIINNPNADHIILEDMEGNVIFDKLPISNQKISLEGIEKGAYIVVIGEQRLKILIQ